MNSINTCRFCSYQEKLPKLLIHNFEHWSVVHTDQFFPEGSVFILAKFHGLSHEVPSPNWKDFGPIVSNVSKMLATVGGASRVYMVSFSELAPHFHLIAIPKSNLDSERAEGKAGAALVAHFIEKNTPNDSQKVEVAIAKYKTYLSSSAF